jgi:predicted RNA-binding protein with PUA-like domain
MAKRYWLFKSEPSVFSIHDLAKAPSRRTAWEGVRNYQARNMLRDDVSVGDGVLFYHSSTKPTAVVGTAKVVKAGYPDPHQFDARSKYYDAGSKPDDPRWFLVDIEFDAEFKQPVTLEEMRAMPELADMLLLRKGMRLSIQPVTAAEWKAVCKRGR